MSGEETFNKLLEHFLQMKDVKKTGNSLKINRKMFVMLNKGRMVVKLPDKRVQELIQSGKGLPFDASTGKNLKEWAIIPLRSLEEWIAITDEAKDFAFSISKK